MKSYFLLFLITSFEIFCQNKHQSEKINLNNGFHIPGEPDTDFAYKKISIYNNNTLVFSDSTHEFARGKISFQKVYPFKNNVFSILVESFEAPNKNLLYCYEIKNNKVKRKNVLPLFLNLPKNLDDDNNLEVAGFWDNFQRKENSISHYEPIIFYEFTTNGIKLDRDLTIRRNKYIYGKFYGYKIDENVKFSSSTIHKKIKFEQKRIKRKP